MPTALPPPAGTWAFEDWELFLVSLSYAASDQLVITGTTLIPVSGDFYWGFVSAKLQVVKAGALRLAAQAGTGGAIVTSSGSSDSGGGGSTCSSGSSCSTGSSCSSSSCSSCGGGGCSSS